MADDNKTPDPKQTSGTRQGARKTKARPASATAKDATADAKAKAKSAAEEARRGASGVAEEARQTASQVADDATEAVSELAASASEQIQEAAAEQKEAAAERVLRIADAVDRAGGELDREIPFVGDYVHRTARELKTVGTTVRDRDLRELVGVTQDFARRQPALFAGVAGLIGFAAVRFVMASTTNGAEGYGSASGGSTLGGSRQGGGRGEAALQAALREADGSAADGPSGDPGGVAPRAPNVDFDALEEGDPDREDVTRADAQGEARTGDSDDLGKAKP